MSHPTPVAATSHDRARRLTSAGLVVAALLEAALLGKLLTMTDFADPLQVMVLIATCAVFGAVCIGLAALGGYVRSWILETLS